MRPGKKDVTRDGERRSQRELDGKGDRRHRESPARRRRNHVKKTANAQEGLD